jgi:hypothetical protein
VWSVHNVFVLWVRLLHKLLFDTDLMCSDTRLLLVILEHTSDQSSIFFHILLRCHMSCTTLMLMFMLIVIIIPLNILNLYYGLENHIFMATVWICLIACGWLNLLWFHFIVLNIVSLVWISYKNLISISSINIAHCLHNNCEGCRNWKIEFL